ncbi:MAG: hypothetical protein PHX84_01270 [Candidatus Shapirobacteria bacterium]|nr:hypothetical protein [Candidatus Shapirobacteria bacterium]
MEASFNIKVTKIDREDGFRIFTVPLKSGEKQHTYKIYVFDKDLPIKVADLTDSSLKDFARKQMAQWIMDSDGKLPKNKYRVLVNGGKITTDDIESFMSVKKKASDLIRTNVTISAPLFEWAKAKAQKEETSFSDLVSRGLIAIKNSDQQRDLNKEFDSWLEEQGAYFRSKLGNFGSFEVFHYLPDNQSEFGVDLIKASLQAAEQRRTGWPIGAYLTGGEQRPHPQLDGIKAEYTSSDYLRLDYWYAKHKGEFYFARNLESDSGNGNAEPKTCLYFDTLIWRVAESFEHCIAYYQNLNVSADERIKIKISLYGLNGRALSAWNQMRAFTLHNYTCNSDKSSWETETSLTELGSNLDDVIYDSVKKLFILFDFFVPAKEVVNDVLNNEYRKSRM